MKSEYILLAKKVPLLWEDSTLGSHDLVINHMIYKKTLVFNLYYFIPNFLIQGGFQLKKPLGYHYVCCLNWWKLQLSFTILKYNFFNEGLSKIES